MGKIGREYLLTVKGCLPADDAGDQKYAKLGRELFHSGKGVFTEHGLLFVDENTPFQKVYDGQNFPAYVYEEMLCFIRAEYNGKAEYLYIPCEEEAIDKAFARLGAPIPDDVELSWEDHCIENEKWVERFKEIAALQVPSTVQIWTWKSCGLLPNTQKSRTPNSSYGLLKTLTASPSLRAQVIMRKSESL